MASKAKCTVKQIREDAKAAGLKPPSGLRKAQLLEWVQGAKQELAWGLDVKRERQPTDFDINVVQAVTPNYQEFASFNNIQPEWLSHLNVYGWTVVPKELSGISDQLVESVKDRFWNYASSFPTAEGVPRLDRNNSATWIQTTAQKTNKGMFKNYIGHQDFMWDVRKACKGIFSQIYRTQDLVTSFDGGSLTYPIQTQTYKPWFHHDQPRTMKDFLCVQGVVCLTDSGPNDGGFAFMQPREHSVTTFFDVYIKRHPSHGIMWGKVDLTDNILINVPVRKVCARAGDVILFDSRLIHANVPSRGNYRMCTYVSYQPRSRVSAEIAAKRLNAFQEDVMTGHWCYGEWFGLCGKNPNTFGQPLYKPSINNRPSYESVREYI